MRHVFPLFLLLIVLSSCTEEKYPGYSVTSDNLYYQYQAVGDLEEGPVAGNYLTLNLSYATEADSVFYRSVDRLHGPLIWLMDSNANANGFHAALRMMTKGDSMSFVLDAEQFYTDFVKEDQPAFLPAESKLKVAVRLLDSRTEAEVIADREKRNAELSRLEMAEQSALKAEMQRINADSSHYYYGIYIFMMEEGEGEPLQSGDAIQVHYRGSFLGDEHSAFESTYERNMPLDFTVGSPDILIKGLAMAIGKMKRGGKARIVIPSQLAFGSKGVPGIVPPYTTVSYDLEILNE